MQPRITVNMTGDGELEIWVNPQGRDLLVQELLKLSEGNDHFHLSPSGEVETRTRPYRPADKIIWAGKVLYRTDAWDREHYAHVMAS